MTRSVLTFLLLVGLVFNTAQVRNDSAKESGKKQNVPAPSNELSAASANGNNADAFAEQLQVIIDQLDQGKAIPNSRVDKLQDTLKKVINEIIEAQEPPKYPLQKKVQSQSSDEGKKPDNLDRNNLERQAVDIAQDLTTWDRLLTALDQSANDAIRLVDDKSPSRDSTVHLKDRLSEITKRIKDQPRFVFAPPDVDKYMKKSETNDLGFPQADRYIPQIDGDAAESVENSARLRTLGLRLEILERLNALKPKSASSKERLIPAAETNVKTLSVAPVSETAAEKKARLEKLGKAREELKNQLDSELNLAKEAAKPQPDNTSSDGAK